MTFGYWLDPRTARVVSSIYSVEAISDYLQLAYEATKKLEE